MADALKGVASGAQNTVSSGANAATSGASQAGNAATSGASQAGNAASNTASSASNTASTGASQAGNAANTATSGASGTASSGQQKWDAMSEDQKKQTFDALPEDQKQGKSYYQWLLEGYHHQYENWMPWIEDQYLRWFTNDNKASYATKDTLDQSKVTGIPQVDTVQDSVHSAVGAQVGQGGLLQPVGDYASKEGINRAERGGEGEGGGAAGTWTESAKNAGSGIASGVGSAGSYVGGMLPGGGGKGDGQGQGQGQGQ